MLGIRCVGVCVGASQRISLSVLARNALKGPAREISHETGRTREGRSQRTTSRREQQRPVGMRGQSREGHSRQKRAEGGSQEMKAEQRREKNRSQKDDY